MEERSWSSGGKITVMILFSSMGFFGSSCAAAITKNFGALAMSITSVSRKATTLFLSFFLFDNECTFQHIVGIVVFISALTTKSIRRKNKKRKPIVLSGQMDRGLDLELGGGFGNAPNNPNVSRASSTASYDYISDSNTVDTTSTAGSTNRGGRRRGKRAKEHRTRYHVV